MKRILCIQDLAAVGRSSLAVVTPVLAAMGHQCCPLPTALFSTHTGGFSPVEQLDATSFFEGALRAWQAQEIDFDCIYTGYLRTPQQAQIAQQALRQSAAPLKVCDPAMADHGRLYSGFGPEMAEAMAALCRAADLMTPNITEAVMLAGWDYQEAYAASELERLCAQLSSRYEAQVLLTGAPTQDGRVICVGQGAASWERFTLNCSYVDASYPGTGDLFCAVATGALLRGNALQSAAELALRFVESAARATYAAGSEPRFGLAFEPLLGELIPPREERQEARQWRY